MHRRNQRPQGSSWPSGGKLSWTRTRLPAIVAYKQELDQLAQHVLLDNPLLRFDKLLVVSGFSFASNWGANLGKKFLTLSPPRPDGNSAAA